MILRAAEGTPNTSFGIDEIREWRPGDVEALEATGLLRPAEHATSVVCDGCGDGCLADVEFVDGGDEGPLRAYVVCREREDIGRVPVPLERLRRRTVDFEALAGAVADGIGAAGEIEELVKGRLWWLGRATFRAGRSDAFLARGTGQPDADEAIAANTRLQQCSRAVILALWDITPDWLPRRVCLSLPQLVSLGDDRLVIDRDEIEGQVARRFGRSAFTGTRFPTPPGTTWERVSIRIMADGDAAQVTAGNVTEPVTPAQMGMAHARNPAKFTKDWGVLVLLANHGRVGPEDREAHLITPKQVERLRARLRTFFGIEGDPFKPYRSAKGYEPRFALTRIRA